MFKSRFKPLNQKEVSQDKLGLGQPQKDPNIEGSARPATGKQLFGKIATRHHNREASTGLKTGTDNILKSTISLKENTFALIEQLLQESKLVLEAYTKRTSDGGITPGGSGALGGGKGVQVDNKLKVTTTDINRSLTNKINHDSQSRNVSIDNAASIKPQITTRGETIGLTQSATNTNASVNQSTNQRQQEKWDAQQQEQQG